MDKTIILFSDAIDLLTSVIIGWVILLITGGGCFLISRNIRRRCQNRKKQNKEKSLSA